MEWDKFTEYITHYNNDRINEAHIVILDNMETLSSQDVEAILSSETVIDCEYIEKNKDFFTQFIQKAESLSKDDWKMSTALRFELLKTHFPK
jgi:hypothetical protein